MNPTGKYNLNFIDWENEMDAVLDADYDSNDPDESPIYGMDIETFKWISVSTNEFTHFCRSKMVTIKKSTE